MSGPLKIGACFVIICTFAAFGKAQSKQSRPEQPLDKAVTLRRSPEIENLISTARTLPAEFAVDALIRIAASNQVDTKWKHEILEEAFILTSNVQNPLRLRAVSLPATSADTRANYLSSAFEQQLDALSLRSRIISQVMATDKNRALRMLSEISPRLPLKELSCADWISYDVSTFYKTLQALSQTAFEPKRIQQGERVQFLLPYVEGMTSPVQIGPVAKLISDAKLTSREVTILNQAFASALKKVSGDDRSFSISLSQDRALRDIMKLIEVLRRKKISYSELLNALHDYLARHLTGVRCEDNVLQIDRELPPNIREANYLFPNSPFMIADIQPGRIEPSPKIQAYFESRESAELLKLFQNLNYYDNEQRINEETKATVQWQQRVLDYLQLLEAWDGKSEASETDVFNQKSGLYLALISITPSGPTADQILSSYIQLLTPEGRMNENRILWMLHANRAFSLVAAKQGIERANMLKLLIYSPNPVVQLYGELINARLF